MGTITVKGLGKAFKRYPTRWARLAEWLDPRDRPRHQLHWVLKDINFTVQPGEAVGIIGVNGAGKSTLLKLITGTSQPTTGNVQMTGRVAALLELGMGFHQEFTGRQNVYMAGQLLGLSTDVISELMSDIIEYSEIGTHIDLPIRVYSSGMQMRLAFSVATVIRPDILIVDEALSVGDAYFQHKSIERIKRFQSEGTTLLLVSHDRNAIQGMCGKAILLEDGGIAMIDTPANVMDYYNALLSKRQPQSLTRKTLETGHISTRSGTGEAVVESCMICDLSGKKTEILTVGSIASLEVRVRTSAPIKRLVLGILIKDKLGQPVFGTNTWHTDQVLIDIKADESIVYRAQFPSNFGHGTYSISLSLASSDTHLEHNFDWIDLAAIFSVVNTDKPTFVGSTWIPCQIHIDRNSFEQ